MGTTSEHFPLSPNQEQLWYVEQLSPGEPTYNLYGAYRLRGRLDLSVLGRSLSFVLNRHDVLRGRFGEIDGVPYQQFMRPVEIELGVTDLTGAEDTTVNEAVAGEVSVPFNLAVGPLYRFRVFRVAPADHVFFFSFHHIVTDGWSNGMIMREVALAYRAFVAGCEPILAQPQLNYVEHVQAQRDRMRGAAAAEDLAFWDSRLAGLHPLELPTDRRRPPDAGPSEGDAIWLDLDGFVVGLRKLAVTQGVSLFTVLAAGLITVFHRYTGQDDIPLGVPLLGRTELEQEDVVGLFVNMAVLRTDLSGDPSFAELLKRVADVAIDAHEHQEVPFETVVRQVRPHREPGRNPLFQVSVQMVDDSVVGRTLDLPDIEAELLSLPPVRSMFDLVVNFFAGEESLRVFVGYDTDLFDRWRVEALLGHLQEVLTGATRDPSVVLSHISLLTAAERDDLLRAGCGVRSTQPDQPLHVTIADVAAADPDAVAAVCRGVELTYGDLDHRAGLVARRLRASGVRHQHIVAVAMDRDLDTLTVLLGVLKAGAAFVVLDPTHPVKRLEHLLRDTTTPLVVTRSGLVDRLPPPDGWEVVAVDTWWDAPLEDIEGEPLIEWAAEDSLAYVIYTSGSTGRPKGVLVEHQALRCHTESLRDLFGLASHDRMLQFCALTFDVSMGEIFCGLTTGATLVLVAPEDVTSPQRLAEVIRTERVSYLYFTPAVLAVVDAGPYPDLRYVVTGAETVPADVINSWNLSGRRMVCTYGPTEAAVACTEYECEHRQWTNAAPIGHPQADRQVYVVDRFGNLAPRGVAGELLIGGDRGLARGYLNQPELTAQSFVPDPFRSTGRVYRSGDLVRWNHDYELEFLGRMDDQIKLRGMRIELGEIEALLRGHSGVLVGAVMLRPDARGQNRLVAYHSGPAASADVCGHLAELLPEYMVPTAWVPMAEFPLTSSRKIDRRALPEPDDCRPVRSPALLSTTEAAVADVFADVLGLPSVCADESFFDLGGNSLQGMQVVSRIGKTFGVRMSVRWLYGSTTVAEVAARIDASVGTTEGVAAHE